MVARVQVPKEAKRGEVIRVGILIQHPMETGYRLDSANQKVPKNAIRKFSCRYNGVEIFSAEMSPGIAANPFLQFPTVAAESGTLEFSWVDDNGEQGSARENITVA